MESSESAACESSISTALLEATALLASLDSRKRKREASENTESNMDSGDNDQSQTQTVDVPDVNSQNEDSSSTNPAKDDAQEKRESKDSTEEKEKLISLTCWTQPDENIPKWAREQLASALYTYRSEYYMAVPCEEFFARYGAPQHLRTSAEAELMKARERRAALAAVVNCDEQQSSVSTDAAAKPGEIIVPSCPSVPYTDFMQFE